MKNKTTKYTLKALTCWLGLLAFPICILAQDDKRELAEEYVSESLALPVRETNQAYMFGIGGTNMYDTYLSPLEYKGTSFKVFNERMRRTTWLDNRFFKQQIIGLEFAYGDNLAKNASRYKLQLDYRLGGHYRLIDKGSLKVGVGALWNANAGIVFNERNGNNPASGVVYTNIDASVMASYIFKNIAIRWQMDSPFVGMLFSPRFGQSYYEISLGNSVGLVNFASLHNQRALRNYISVDVPIYKYIVRVGYLGTYHQTKVHSINTHSYTHSFVLGLPMEGFMKKKQKTKNIYWK